MPSQVDMSEGTMRVPGSVAETATVPNRVLVEILNGTPDGYFRVVSVNPSNEYVWPTGREFSDLMSAIEFVRKNRPTPEMDLFVYGSSGIFLTSSKDIE